MSNNNFVKGECRHCAGHLEYPVEAAGQTVACPHCGQPTELAAPVLSNKSNRPSRIWPVIIVVVCLVAAGLAGAFLYLQKNHRPGDSGEKPLPPTPSNMPAVLMNPPVAPPKPQAQETTNDFAIMPFKLEKTPASSLFYVTGSIQTLSDHQRFGVKVEFGLFDANDSAVGSATDYQSVIETHGEWRFKAMVMASKAVSARFNSIAEDK